MKRKPVPGSRASGVGRRQFLRRVGALAGAALAAPRAAGARTRLSPGAAAGADGLALVLDPGDPVASSRPVQLAALRLREVCASRGLAVRSCRSLEEARATELSLLAAGSGRQAAIGSLGPAGIGRLDAPQSLAIAPGRRADRAFLLAAAPDALGLAYALAELGDRVECAAEPRGALAAATAQVERPRCRIRSVMRLFASDIEDKGWFHDRSFWPAYLDMLVAHRFNRFNLALGLGYDFARGLRDSYFYFPYPFLLAVPGHDVRASGLTSAERDRNLESLRFIGEQATRRGLHFQLGLWTHAFQWTESPEVNYTITGLTPESHAAYCRAALGALLAACPEIQGLTLRTHGESGVPEADAGRYEFWRTLMSAVAGAGRPLEIDLHAKGVDQKLIDIALGTGQPVRVSPKFWAEHMGLPYLQSSIRALELPRADAADRLMAISTGSRNHMRYSYGDLLGEERRYGILHRVWPGTERLLLWGDPAYAAEMGRAFSALGADGVEYMEPLSFKGRKGSGLPGGRDAYRDASLRDPLGDWHKYEYTYRLWGRLAYDPEAEPETWRRRLRRDLGDAASAVETGLAQASRILPLVTSAHCPSAANNNFWPEMYTNMSIVDETIPGSYSDTPTPKLFGTVSSLDPQLFASAEECAEALVRREHLARTTPIDVARQLDLWSESATAQLAQAHERAGDRSDPRLRRIAIDCAIAVGLGRFFARKLRAAVLFGIFDRSGSARARDEAVRQYRAARLAWADFALGPAQAYARDVSFGFASHLRGHWEDRLPAIDRDIAALEAREARRAAGPVDVEAVALAIAAVLAPRPAPSVSVEHTPQPWFQPGQALTLAARVAPDAASVRLVYRHLDQAESYATAEMARDGASWRAAVPAEYTRSAYPVQYYFEVRLADGVALFPGFKADFTGQPYFLSRPERAKAAGSRG